MLNKFDLAQQSAQALQSLALYRELGYTVLPLVAKRDVSPLRAHLEGQLSVLVGQSGMGKSTIINALVPGAGAADRRHLARARFGAPHHDARAAVSPG